VTPGLSLAYIRHFQLFKTEIINHCLKNVLYLRERCRDAYKELKDIEKLTWIRRAIEQEHNYDVSYFIFSILRFIKTITISIINFIFRRSLKNFN
jgi:hypothetical protein